MIVAPGLAVAASRAELSAPASPGAQRARGTRMKVELTVNGLYPGK